MTEQETNLFHYVLNWVEKNTEYEPVSVPTYKGKIYYNSGMAQDWVYKEFRIPTFIFEILSTDYEPGMGEGKTQASYTKDPHSRSYSQSAD